MGKNSKSNAALAVIILLILQIPFILYILSFKIIAFNESFYQKEFLKYDVYSEFPDDDIDSINGKLLGYLRYDKTNNHVDISLFDEKEKEHLLDVKVLIQNILSFLYSMIFLFFLLLIFLALAEKTKLIQNLSKIFFWGGIITFLDALLFILAICFNFKLIFGAFHKLFFKSGTWLFSSDSALIRIYQQNFFFDITFSIVLMTLIFASISILSGLLLKNKKILNTLSKNIK